MRLRHLMLASVAMLLPVFGSEPFAHGQQTGPSLVVEDSPKHSFTVVARMKGRQTPIVRAVKRVESAVVNIHSERTVRPVAVESFQVIPSQGRVNGMGTGVIIDARGYIVTNHHVVEDVNVLRIRLSDGTAKDAVVVARDPEIDLALIKIDVDRPLPVMPIGTAIDLMRGETVIAVGNAYGYEHTVSVGVVSAVKRDVRLNKDMFYKQLIQTDASINPGNSGGPLVNIHGELVGVNVAIRAGAQGIGFAIPVDHVVRAVAKMLRERRQASIYDGFICKDRLEKQQDGYIRQVVVDNVLPDGPASIAGLQAGDVVTKVGTVPVKCEFDVERGLMGRNVGEEISIGVYRQGRVQFTKLILQAKGHGANRLSNVLWSKLGVLVSPVHPELVRRVSDRLHGGLKVQAVHESRAAAKAGIQQGDILVGLHQWETLSLDNVVFVLEHPELSTFNPVRFYIVREGQVRRGSLSVGQ